MSSLAGRERAADLAAIFKVASAINSSLDTKEILKVACAVAVEMLDLHHCGLALLDTQMEHAMVVAEYPDTLGTLGLRIKVKGIPAEERLIQEREPVFLLDVLNDEEFGEVGANAAGYGIKSMLLVPIISKDSVIGTIGLDTIGAERLFTDEELGFCKVLASQVALALDRANLFHTIEQRRKLLDDLDEKSRHLLIEKDEATLKQDIVRLAVELFGARAAGLYTNYAHLRQLELTNVYGLPADLCGTRISHDQGIAGEVARCGKAALVEHCSECEQMLAGAGVHSVIAAPLSPAGTIEAVLFVGRQHGQAALGEAEMEILERFAARASLALEAKGVRSPQHRMTRHLKILHVVRDYVQRSQDLDKIVNVLLTGMTATFGLGFNRVVLFMLDDDGTRLRGSAGIGQFTEAEARAAWEVDRQLGLHSFERYFELLEKGELPVTDLHKKAPDLVFQVDPLSGDAFSKAVLTQESSVQKTDKLLPKAFCDALNPMGPVLLAPMIARNRVIGLLVVDNKFTGNVLQSEEVESLLTFASTAAAAIDNYRLFERAQKGHETFRSLYHSTEYLISEKDPAAVIQELGEALPEMTGSQDVSLILVRPQGEAEILVASHPVIHDASVRIRPNGISRRVLSTRKAIAISDAATDLEANPAMLASGWKAGLCLPLIVSGEPIGVAWLHYKDTHEFSAEEIEYLQLHASHAAIAYNNALRVIRLERLQKATRGISSAFDLARVRQEIVEGARTVLDAEFGALWPYDDRLKRFVVQEFTSDGIPDEALALFREHGEPLQGRTTFTALETGYMFVPDLEKAAEYPFLSSSVIQALGRAGIKSFQGAALKVGAEAVGVLYVSYRYARTFNDEDERRLRNFATYAALALKKAMLLEQKDKLVKAIEAVAQVNALHSWNETLQSVAHGMKGAIGCTSIVLYAYNPTTKSLSYPPVTKDVRFPEAVMQLSKIPPTSVVLKMLVRDEPYEVPSIKNDPLFSVTKFAAREGIASCIAVPLRAGNLKVGVMFVNYADPHLFTPEEVDWIKLFAHHAAMAIRQAQVIEEQRRLAELSRALLGTVNVQEVLDHGVEMGASMLRTELCNIVLPGSGEDLIFAAAYGWEETAVGRAILKRGRLSHAGYTIQENRHVIVEDFKTETRFEQPEIGKRYGITSALSVPMIRDNEVVGAMLVQSKEPRIFTEAEATLLQVIANQTALALSSAQRYQALERSTAHLRSLYDAFASAIRDPNIEEAEILSGVLHHAVSSVTPAQKLKVALGSIQRYDPEARTWKFAAFYSEPDMAEARARAEDMPRESGSSPLGITGRVVRTGEPQLVSDVSQDSDYYWVHPETRSEIAVPIRSHDGHLTGVLNLESDRVAAFDKKDLENLSAFANLVVMVFELTRLYKDLREKDRRKTELFEVISHELRTPIQSIKVALQSLLNGNYGEITGRKRGPMAMALTRVDEQDRLVSDLLDATRVMEGIDDLKWAWTSLSSLIDTTRSLFRPIAEENGVQFFVETTDDTLMVYMDGNRIQRVLNNLVANALKFTSAGGSVTVRSEALGDRVVVRVRDTGTGITHTELDRIFERYYQADETILRSRGGLGIGLYIVKKYVELHRGTVGVTSEPGVGSIFSFTLPIGADLQGGAAPV